MRVLITSKHVVVIGFLTPSSVRIRTGETECILERLNYKPENQNYYNKGKDLGFVVSNLISVTVLIFRKYCFLNLKKYVVSRAYINIRQPHTQTKNSKCYLKKLERSFFYFSLLSSELLLLLLLLVFFSSYIFTLTFLCNADHICLL